MSCTADSATLSRRPQIPGVIEQDIRVKGNGWGRTVTEEGTQSDTSPLARVKKTTRGQSPREICVAQCVGKVKKMFLYTVQDGEEFVACRREDPQGVYTVFSEIIEAGADVSFGNQVKESSQEKGQISAHVGIPGWSAEAGVSYGAESAGADLSRQQCKVNCAVVRIIVSGGKESFFCTKASTLDLFVVTKKREQTRVDESIQVDPPPQPAKSKAGTLGPSATGVFPRPSRR